MWTALTLAAIVAFGATAYGAWAWHAVAHGAAAWPFVVGLPFAYLALPLVLTVSWFVLAAWFGVAKPREMRLGLPAWIAMFLREFWSLARSAPRMILYRFNMPEPPAAPAPLPVVLLHGVGCNAGVWCGLRRHLAALGIGPVYALSYGPPLASIDLFGDELAARIAAIRAATGAPQVVLVGHSMGGLVARAYLRRHGGQKVRRLVTVGTPHHGSMHAWLMFGQSLSQMRPGSAWLAELNAGAHPAPTVSVWSWDDSMVTPQTSSRIDWGENAVLSGIAHNALLDHPAVWAKVVAEIRRAATSESPA